LDSSGNVVSSGVTGNDLFLTTTSLEDLGGGDIAIGSTTPNVPENSFVYAIFFNASSIASATEIAVTGYDGDPKSPFDVGQSGIAPNPVKTYGIGTEIQSDFYAVPEPAVAGLIGIFGMGLIATRRIFRKDI
jgi:hypothetical protein